MSCPFCSVKNIRTQLVSENALFYIIGNTKPIIEGHLLVIPKRHILTPLEFDDMEWKKYNDALRWSYNHILETQKVNAIAYTNAPESFSVQHLHFHIMPCFVKPHQIENLLRSCVDIVLKKQPLSAPL